MTQRRDWGLRLLVVGAILGMAVITFVGVFNTSPFYQTYAASAPMTEALPPLGYALDGTGILAFGLILGGMAVVSFGPVGNEAPEDARPPRVPRQAPSSRPSVDRESTKRRQPPAPHGST